MNTQLNRMLFSRAFVKVSACVVLSAGCLPMATYAESVGAPVVETVLQQKAISGKVVDSKGESIIGANIMEKGTSNGTITDFDGNFSLNVSAKSVLQISYIGYKTQEIPVSQLKAGAVITLKEDTEVMDEVVVIGYGTQRKGDVTSAIASVKAEDFTVGKVGDAADLIKGKVAGLSIAKGSGDPNATSAIRLRGVISVNGSTTPLILIDGVEGDLSTVAPENIEAIDVLKDASAAAIYGTRGANGVILITTKTGKREAHTTASYSGYVSASQFGKKLDFMTAEDVRAGKTNFTDKGYDTDWLDAISRTGFTHNHNFNISGGTKQTTYSADFTYRKEDGVIMNTYAEDIRMRFDVSHWMLNDMLKVNLNMVKKWHKNSATNATATDQSNIYRQAIARNPTAPIYNEDGSYNEDFGVNYYYNPVGMLEERLGNYTYEETRAAGNITFEPIKGWQTNLMLATSRFGAHDKGYNTSDYYGNQLNQWTGYAYHTNSESFQNNLELTSKYDLNVGKHRMNAMVGYSYQYYKYEQNYANNYNFPTDFFQWNNLGIGQALKEGKAGMGSSASENTLIGFFARVSYAYDNRYNLLVSVRREGSSKFGDNNKWGTFPSASLGWTISNEEFMKGITWLNNLKLRAGFGITGVIPNDPYISLTKYAYGSSYYYSDGKWLPGLSVSSNPNPDLRWEKSTEFNVGLDWSVLDNRLGGSIDVYNKKTTDLLFLYTVPTPPNLFNSTLANAGSVRNQGIEVAVNAVPVRTKDFEWKTVVTVSANKNKLLSLSNDMYESNSFKDSGGLGEPINISTHRMEEGRALGEFYGLKSVGVSENGLFLIEKPDGEVVEFSNDQLKNDEYRQYLGSGLPKVYLGWTNNLSYKNWDLSMQFTSQLGFKILNEPRAFYENNSIAYNRLKSVEEAPYGGQYTLSSSQPQTFVSYYLEDGDFLKLTNLTIGYTFPIKKNNKYIKGVRAYLSGDNLFCITGYSGLDPELSNWYPTSAGIDARDKYPSIRSFTFGLNLTF
ncbi:SusC/RagA family TonB-linked outer membrane protein [Phocaeicola plebeius]|jgi:TonB-linked SusC/RagA family outer membrane protein|uniref:TonB-dependent receptor n=1 Tax=Phocaeicola plebeius TaxID=310297 RepID=A0A412H556_9BACT|nr:TonB-dependent receptor [Phocaeicola plebeius]RGR88975.1 TonB-dependent receptor [Phocaeicola plebeius]RGS06982.1 TonB-dependent receptor [Phocaeicola plebeius]RHA28300.1 TonB-dependent receptor [Phocaeicola plebeius]RHA32485.1 TonB-dependent receptor [Phocaeicola plebeius]RHM95029.1 TonB-dependent receptor [Phocaeicola plebeius]